MKKFYLEIAYGSKGILAIIDFEKIESIKLSRSHAEMISENYKGDVKTIITMVSGDIFKLNCDLITDGTFIKVFKESKMKTDPIVIYDFINGEFK